MRNYEQMIQNDTKWPKHDKIISNEIKTITKKSVEVYLSTCSYQSVFGPQVWLKETQQWAEKETFGLPESVWGTALVWWLTNCSLMNVWCSSGLFVRSVKKLQRLKGESWAFLSMLIPREKLQKCTIRVLWFILLIIVIILHQSVIWMSNRLQWLILAKIGFKFRQLHRGSRRSTACSAFVGRLVESSFHIGGEDLKTSEGILTFSCVSSFCSNVFSQLWRFVISLSESDSGGVIH